MKLRTKIIAAGVAVVAATGYSIPRWGISNGMEMYTGDPLATAVAESAYESVWHLNDNPVGRVMFPGARVRRVWRDPGHCPPDARVAAEPTAQIRAEVRTYTWFGIPGPLVEVTCGGWSYGVR